MLIAKVKDGAVIDIADYRSMFPNTSFPKGPTGQFLHENDCMKVSTFVDHDSTTHKLQPCEPYVNGNFVYTVEAVAKTEEELAAELAVLETNVRKTRDQLLTDSDWIVAYHTEKGTQIPTEWQTYRQALRDVTNQEGFPSNVIWPDKPE